MTAPARQTPITGEEFDALRAENWLRWAQEDLARVDPRPDGPIPRQPAKRRDPTLVAKLPQVTAVESPRRSTWEERMARLEALVGPMRAMPRSFLMTEPTPPFGYAAHLMRMWGGR